MKEVLHENLNPFVGAIIDPPNIDLIGKYCPKGSLQVRAYSSNTGLTLSVFY